MSTPSVPVQPYRGRLAPSPTGHLHLGHARTFWIAQERARARGGTLILRNDDLDRARCKSEFGAAMYEDLKWFGFAWREGPDCGGPFAPYNQSERTHLYRIAIEQLLAGGFIYPCTCSRKDIAAATRAPHAEDDDEPLYPGTCREKFGSRLQVEGCKLVLGASEPATFNLPPATRYCWRFRIPAGAAISFVDANLGSQTYIAGQDFGDFVVWRPDDVPSYQLACVVDDAAMKISEVVRGADLLKSTARQLLLYRALNLTAPDFYHCALMTDETGQRLAKRHDSLSLRTLRQRGEVPEKLRSGWSC